MKKKQRNFIHAAHIRFGFHLQINEISNWREMVSALDKWLTCVSHKEGGGKKPNIRFLCLISLTLGFSLSVHRDPRTWSKIFFPLYHIVHPHPEHLFLVIFFIFLFRPLFYPFRSQPFIVLFDFMFLIEFIFL